MDIITNNPAFGSVLPTNIDTAKPSRHTMKVQRDTVVVTQNANMRSGNMDSIGRLARQKTLGEKVEKQPLSVPPSIQLNNAMFDPNSGGGGGNSYSGPPQEEQHSQEEEQQHNEAPPVIPGDILITSERELASFWDHHSPSFYLSPESYHQVEEDLVTAFLPFQMPISPH